MSTTLGIVKNDAGAIVGTVTVERDIYAPHDMKPHEYMDMIGAVRVVGAGYDVDESFFKFGAPLGSVTRAWERFSEEYGEREAAGVLARYVAAFRPDVALIEQRVLTGYSQGDEVRLIAWVTLAELKREGICAGEPHYRVLSAGHDMLEAQMEVIGAIARGQFWDVTRHDVVDVAYTGIDASEGAMTASAEFVLEEMDSISTLALEEFDPIEELVECAEHNLLDAGECLEVTARTLN